MASPDERVPREHGLSEEVEFDTAEDGERDDLAEELGEAFVLSATTGDDGGSELIEEEVPEESGGPFLETSGRVEFGRGVDASNPVDAEPQPLPIVSPLPKRPGR